MKFWNLIRRFWRPPRSGCLTVMWARIWLPLWCCARDDLRRAGIARVSAKATWVISKPRRAFILFRTCPKDPPARFNGSAWWKKPSVLPLRNRSRWAPRPHRPTLTRRLPKPGRRLRRLRLSRSLRDLGGPSRPAARWCAEQLLCLGRPFASGNSKPVKAAGKTAGRVVTIGLL